MDDRVRLGIIGTGSLGTSLGEQARPLDQMTVTALADSSEVPLTEAAEVLEVPEHGQYSDWERMIEEAPLDAVIVATPHTLHFEQVMAAIEQGLDVLCEKPLTTDLEHARTLRDRSAESDSTLMVGYQRHLDPVYMAARDRIQDGSPPNVLTASITQDWIGQFRDAWRADPDLSGGGQLYDTGSHLLDAVLWTTGLTPTAVSAEMVFEDRAQRVDIQAVLTVAFAEGAVGSITVSGDTPAVREHIHVWSDDGGTYIDAANWSEVSVTAIAPDGSESPLSHGDGEQPTKVAAFLESIRNETPPPATADDAFAVRALTAAAYESARAGERVTIDW